MATKNPKDTLAEPVTEKKLSIIAKSIGSNWQFLAPFLLESNCTVTVEHIIADHGMTIMRIYQLLLTWSKEAGQDAMLGLLFNKMLQSGTSVTIEWKTIAEELDIDERDIRACKTGYERPVQEINTNQPIKTVKDVNRDSDLPTLHNIRYTKAYRPPKETRIYDGRLMKLAIQDIEDLNKTCNQRIGRGAYGNVYKSNGVSDGFGIQIALKKIVFPADGSRQTRIFEREMMASTILHPFIRPLLAVVDLRPGCPEFWIVSPFFENGNLQQAIANKKIPLDTIDRVKILIHLATAIQYIHTAVPNVRNVILHNDISSTHVVLDQANNARLIDFGLAQEKDDQTSYGKERIAYAHPDCGTEKGATECWDYFSFGVIVREMLTGLGPEGRNDTLLKDMKSDEVLNELESDVWWIFREPKQFLNDIADQCLTCDGWTADEFKTNVVEKTISNYINKYSSKSFVPGDNKRCHICIINPKAKKTSMTQKHAEYCFQQIEVCIACEKNSFLNPITCYCGVEMAPLGSRWGALLVAGNDEKSETFATGVRRDVLEIRKLLTSKAPCVVGIRESNVRTVTPDCPDYTKSNEQELLLPKIRENVKYFQKRTEIDTLLIYFSCRGSRGDQLFSFVLGSVSERVTLTDFQDMLDDLDDVDNLIIILDCSNPPKIKLKKKNRKVIQINACEETKQAKMKEDGSLFTKTLIQGLKGKAERLGCSQGCQFCRDYFDGCFDFITVSSIYEYLENHTEDQKPVIFQEPYSYNSNIAYFTDEQVQIQFTNNNKQQVVQLEYLQDMEQLRSKLSEVFGKEKIKYSVRVQRNTYRTDKEFEDCDTIEKVMQAWVHRQPLIVKFESIKQTDPSN